MDRHSQGFLTCVLPAGNTLHGYITLAFVPVAFCFNNLKRLSLKEGSLTTVCGQTEDKRFFFFKCIENFQIKLPA